jgi:hypothetical protein
VHGIFLKAIHDKRITNTSFFIISFISFNFYKFIFGVGRQLGVRTQFSKDDVDASDPLIADLFDMGVDGDDGM